MRNLAFPASQNLFVGDNPVSYNNSEKFIHNSTFELNPNTIVNIFWIELFLIYWYFCLITTKKKKTKKKKQTGSVYLFNRRFSSLTRTLSSEIAMIVHAWNFKQSLSLLLFPLCSCLWWSSLWRLQLPSRSWWDLWSVGSLGLLEKWEFYWFSRDDYSLIDSGVRVAFSSRECP